MKSNLFVSKESVHEVQAYSYSPSSPIDPREHNKTLRALENRLLRNGVITAVFGDKVYALKGSNALPPRLEAARKYTFTLNANPETFRLAEHPIIFGRFLLSSLKSKAYSLGYIGPEGSKLIEKEPYKKELFNYHHAFTYDIETFPDGKMGIWLDPTTRWKQPLSNHITYWIEKGKSKEEILSNLIGMDVHCPSTMTGGFFHAKIASASTKKLKDHIFAVSGSPTSLFDWWTKKQECASWLNRNNIVLTPEDDIIIEVEFEGQKLSYPHKVLELIIDLDEVPAEATHEKKTFDPKKRITETETLAKKILGSGLQFGPITLSFQLSILEWNQSSREYGQIIHLTVPDLLFGQGQVLQTAKSDPFVVGHLQRYGPITRKVQTNITYILPEALKAHLPSFHSILAKNAEELGFGTFTYSPEKILTVQKEDPYQYQLGCQKAQKEDGIAVVIQAPGHDIHYKSKKGLGNKLVKSQMLFIRTFQRIVQQPDDRFTKALIYNLVAGIYDKGLEEGGVMWLLSKPAGNLPKEKKILFIGFDVSRNPESKKEAAAYAAICDSYGRILYRKVIQSHRGEVMKKEAIRDWLFEIATDTGHGLIDELVVFKDGSIRTYEVEFWKEGTEEAKRILVENNLMKPEGNIRIITVIKMGPHRIYSDDFDMKASNVALVRNSKQAILVTARPIKGTPDSLRLAIEHQLIDDMDISQVVRIFNDLRFLDWESLYKQPKTILPLHIVQNLAIYSKEDILIPYAPR